MVLPGLNTKGALIPIEEIKRTISRQELWSKMPQTIIQHYIHCNDTIYNTIMKPPQLFSPHQKIRYEEAK